MASIRPIDLAKIVGSNDAPATVATELGVAIGERLFAAAGSLGAGTPAVAGLPAAVAAAEHRRPRAPTPGGAAGKSNGRRGKRAQHDKPQHAATFRYACFHHAPAEMRSLAAMHVGAPFADRNARMPRPGYRISACAAE